MIEKLEIMKKSLIKPCFVSNDLFNLHKYNFFINKLSSGEKIELEVRNMPQLAKIELEIVDTQHGSYSYF